MNSTGPAARRPPQSTLDLQSALDTLDFHETVMALFEGGNPDAIGPLLVEARESARTQANLTEERDRINVLDAFQTMDLPCFIAYLRGRIHDEHIENEDLIQRVFRRAFADFTDLWAADFTILSDLREAIQHDPSMLGRVKEAEERAFFAGFMVYLSEECPFEVLRDYIHMDPEDQATLSCREIHIAIQEAFMIKSREDFMQWLSDYAQSLYEESKNTGDTLVETLNSDLSDDIMDQIGQGRDASEFLVAEQELVMGSFRVNLDLTRLRLDNAYEFEDGDDGWMATMMHMNEIQDDLTLAPPSDEEEDED